MKVKMSHEEFLRNELRSVRLELEELEVQKRVFISVFDSKREMLWGRIDSLESQLQDHETSDSIDKWVVGILQKELDLLEDLCKNCMYKENDYKDCGIVRDLFTICTKYSSELEVLVSRCPNWLPTMEGRFTCD